MSPTLRSVVLPVQPGEHVLEYRLVEETGQWLLGCPCGQGADSKMCDFIKGYADSMDLEYTYASFAMLTSALLRLKPVVPYIDQFVEAVRYAHHEAMESC